VTVTLLELLDSLPHEPEDVLIVCGETSLTKQEFVGRIAELAAALTNAGVAQGQPIGNLTGSGPAAMVAMFAVWQVGAVYVPMNRRSTTSEIEAFLADTPCAAVIAEADDLGLHDLRTGQIVHDFNARRAIVAQPADRSVVPHGSDVAFVLRTSGTTGRPKAVLIRHEGTLTAFDSSLAKLRGKRSEGETVRRPLRMNLIPVSLALWAGIWNSLFSLRGGFGLLLIDRFEPVEFARLVRDFGIKSTIMPPAMITMLTDEPIVQDLAPLNMVRSITAPLSPVQAREFHRRFGAFVLNCYGQTELGGEVVGWTAKDVREFGESKLGAAGRPYDSVALKVVDASGHEVGTDEYGELLVRSPYMMQGYANGDEDDRIVDGFLRTGDIGRVDADGFLWVEGRVSDMINRGGNKVFPDEVEEALRAHPAVRDAAVAAAPDRRLGEVPHAWIVLADPAAYAHGVDALAAQLTDWCRERLVPYKIPAGYTVLDELPRSEIGKVLRRELTASVS
jgi:acyl-CoA synthetase (AMP-forming)/AMP-acid ligase II